MGRPPQCDHCCPTTTTTTTTTDEPPITTPPPVVTTTPDPPLPCSFYGVSYFYCRYRYDSDAGRFFFVEGSVPSNCNCFCPGASRVYTDFVAANGGPPSDGACATYLMPCCTEDNVNSFSCEPVGIIIEAICSGDPPPLPTTTTTTEDPTATTTAGPTTTTTPTPETPYSVIWCSSRKCEADCCDNGTDLSYIYKPVLCQQFPDLEQAQRFRNDLTNHISYLISGTCEENNDNLQENFCFECNDRCCTTTSTTEDPSATTTTTTTEDPGLGACLLCSDGQIVCTDSITSSTCDFFADIINANWNQHYPNETCSDHPEVGDDCSGFTTTTTTEAPTTTTTAGLTTTTEEPCDCPCPETLNWTVFVNSSSEDCTFSASDAASDTIENYDGGCNGTYSYSDAGTFSCGDAWTSTINCDSSKPANSTSRWSGNLNTCAGSFSCPGGADNPDATGSCGAPPQWTATGSASSGCSCCEGDGGGGGDPDPDDDPKPEGFEQ